MELLKLIGYIILTLVICGFFVITLFNSLKAVLKDGIRNFKDFLQALLAVVFLIASILVAIIAIPSFYGDYREVVDDPYLETVIYVGKVIEESGIQIIESDKGEFIYEIDELYVESAERYYILYHKETNEILSIETLEDAKSDRESGY